MLTALPTNPSSLEILAKAKQKKQLLLLTAIFVVVLLIGFLYWHSYARYFQSTDDAYVKGNIISIASQIVGNVVALNADDTDLVQTNEVLIKLDATDYQVALERAQANLAQTLRQTQQFFINNQGLIASIQSKEANLKKTKLDLTRRQQALAKGAISQEELTNAQDNFDIATASLTQAQSAWKSNRSLTHNTKITTHPAVKEAIARLKKAYLDYLRTSIRSPVTGYVAKRSVQVGQRINVGQVLMAIIPLNEVWVEANFKENQFNSMRIGQPVLLTSDYYGSSVKFHGEVIGFSAGTGSAFSLLPPQNATGNWIKVVQRLPVRIRLDSNELTTHPLRVGLSMQATVDTRQRHYGAEKKRHLTSYKTTIFNQMDHAADQMIQQIIQANTSQDTYVKP